VALCGNVDVNPPPPHAPLQTHQRFILSLNWIFCSFIRFHTRIFSSRGWGDRSVPNTSRFHRSPAVLQTPCLTKI